MRRAKVSSCDANAINENCVYDGAMTRLCLTLFITAATALVPHAQPTTDIKLDDIGPKIGEVAPDFAAPDQHGVPRKLSSLVGPNGAMLVFFRSADW